MPIIHWRRMDRGRERLVSLRVMKALPLLILTGCAPYDGCFDSSYGGRHFGHHNYLATIPDAGSTVAIVAIAIALIFAFRSKIFKRK